MPSSIDYGQAAAALINNELRSISDEAAASWRTHNPLIISLSAGYPRVPAATVYHLTAIA